jgi:hypothetical protein
MGAIAGAVVGLITFMLTEARRVPGGLFVGRSQDDWQMAGGMAGAALFAGLVTLGLTWRWPALRTRALVPIVTLGSVYVGLLLVLAGAMLGQRAVNPLEVLATSVMMLPFALILVGPFALICGGVVFWALDRMAMRAPAPEPRLD